MENKKNSVRILIVSEEGILLRFRLAHINQKQQRSQ